MAFQPVGSLNHRTFTGLIIAQFLAGFNDQAIHASAMFFALHQQALSKEQAISLMPILFFSPWAIFCTIAGHCADRYSKTYSLIFWKIAEIAIALIAMAGFYLGSVHHLPIGPWLVLSTVFLMGTHAAFFAPAKYGAMPEVLQPHILSRGNGVLESTTCLAAILRTVTGGLLSSVCTAGRPRARGRRSGPACAPRGQPGGWARGGGCPVFCPWARWTWAWGAWRPWDW